ncbi:hypothetical protein B0H14DRAFT_2605054 [Mycena olivaceomarginata]|nr:hypothetical protein B0H14DRAFT_2605054 [Mycena olivaceomarginata]
MVSSPRVRLKQVHRAGNNRGAHLHRNARRDVGGNIGTAKVDNTTMWRYSLALDTGVGRLCRLRDRDFLQHPELGSTSWGEPWMLYESILARPKLHGIRTCGVVGLYHLPSLSVRADGNGASDWAAVAGSRKGLMQQLMLESISSLPYVHSKAANRGFQTLPNSLGLPSNLRISMFPASLANHIYEWPVLDQFRADLLGTEWFGKAESRR